MTHYEYGPSSRRKLTIIRHLAFLLGFYDLYGSNGESRKSRDEIRMPLIKGDAYEKVDDINLHAYLSHYGV